MRAVRLTVLDSQHLVAADQGRIISEDGETASRGYGCDEHIEGSALNNVIQAKVGKTGGFQVITA